MFYPNQPFRMDLFNIIQLKKKGSSPSCFMAIFPIFSHRSPWAPSPRWGQFQRSRSSLPRWRRKMCRCECQSRLGKLALATPVIPSFSESWWRTNQQIPASHRFFLASYKESMLGAMDGYKMPTTWLKWGKNCYNSAGWRKQNDQWLDVWIFWGHVI